MLELIRTGKGTFGSILRFAQEQNVEFRSQKFQFRQHLRGISKDIKLMPILQTALDELYSYVSPAANDGVGRFARRLATRCVMPLRTRAAHGRKSEARSRPTHFFGKLGCAPLTLISCLCPCCRTSRSKSAVNMGCSLHHFVVHRSVPTTRYTRLVAGIPSLLLGSRRSVDWRP